VSTATALDARGRVAWLATLADLLEAEPDVVRALRTLEGGGEAAASTARSVGAAVRSGRNLAAALLEARCLSAAEAEALRSLDTPALRAGGLRLLVDRRQRRGRRLNQAAGAVVNPLVLTLVTLLGIQAPLLVLDLVTPTQALRPTLWFLGGLAAVAGLVALAVTRGTPAFWATLARLPGFGGWLARQAEVEVAHALAVLGEDTRSTPAVWTTAAALVPLPVHRATLRTLAEQAVAGTPALPLAPWHPALRLTVLGGAAAGRLRERARGLAEMGDAALTGRLVLVVRLLAFAAMMAVTGAAVDSLLATDIQLPGLPKIDLTNPYGDLEKMLEQELK
jgi:type II secretory pathway component PulF